MALTILIYLFFLFFLGFFSILILCFSSRAHRRAPLLLYTSLPAHHSRYSYRHGRYTHTSFVAGLDPAAVRALPVLQYTGGGGGGGAEEAVVRGCVVCLGEFEEGERIKAIAGCRHVFHPGCIDGWLVLHGSCPICRCSEIFGPGSSGGVWVVDLDETGESRDEERDLGLAVGLVGLGRSKSFDRGKLDCACDEPSLRRISSV